MHKLDLIFSEFAFYTIKWYVYLNDIMSKNTSIILGEHFTNFIKSEIQTGRYKSASEVVRNALRLLEIENKKVEAINRALVVGEKSGKPINFDNLKFKDQMRKKLKQNA